jgi:hypothetical protein
MEGVEGMLLHVIQVSQNAHQWALAYLRDTNACGCKTGSAEAGMLWFRL